MPTSSFGSAPVERALLAAGATVAVQRYRLHAVACDLPLLVIPLSGTKLLHAEGRSWTCTPGRFLMMHFAMQADVENVPSGEAPYRAWVLAFPWEIISFARGLLTPDCATTSRETIATVGELETISDALRAYLADADTADCALRNYRLLGVLLALHRAGHGHFLQAHDPSLSARVRLAVSAAPGREWVSADFEEMFCLSGATLRRRLADEGSSLRLLIQEARLHCALLQLQNSRKPVKAVAREIGYKSVASFRRNFIDRFKLDPAKVANA
jgi:AraC-like DNA-binding protein